MRMSSPLNSANTGNSKRSHDVRLSRALACVGGLIVWAGLIVQFALLVRLNSTASHPWLAALWRYVGFFTILTDLCVAASFLHATAKPSSRRGLGDPRVELCIASAVAVVGLVYSVALRSAWNPQGWQKFADVALHDASPPLYILFYLSRAWMLRWRAAVLAIVFPLAYCLYALARGAADGWYPYYFLDAGALPPTTLARNIAVLTAVFVFAALALIGAARVIAARWSEGSTPAWAGRP